MVGGWVQGGWVGGLGLVLWRLVTQTAGGSQLTAYFRRGGGEGSEIQGFVDQKWPNNRFPLSLLTFVRFQHKPHGRLTDICWWPTATVGGPNAGQPPTAKPSIQTVLASTRERKSCLPPFPSDYSHLSNRALRLEILWHLHASTSY